MKDREMLQKILNGCTIAGAVVFLTLFCLKMQIAALMALAITALVITLILFRMMEIMEHSADVIIARVSRKTREGSFDEAKRYLEKEAEYCITHNFFNEADICFLNLAALYSDSGDAITAGEFIRMADGERIIEMGRDDNIIGYYITYAAICVKTGKKEKAEEFLSQLSQLVDRNRLDSSDAVHKVRAEYYTLCGRYASALAEAEKITTNNDTMKLIVICLKISVLISMKEYSEAHRLIESAKELKNAMSPYKKTVKELERILWEAEKGDK